MSDKETSPGGLDLNAIALVLGVRCTTTDELRELLQKRNTILLTGENGYYEVNRLTSLQMSVIDSYAKTLSMIGGEEAYIFPLSIERYYHLEDHAESHNQIRAIEMFNRLTRGEEDQPPVRIQPWPKPPIDMEVRPFVAPLKSCGVLSDLNNADRYAQEPRNVPDKSVGERESIEKTDGLPYVPGQALAEVKAMFDHADKTDEKK
jgi:hypothetical protein